jgi:hypothetical protein
MGKSLLYYLDQVPDHRPNSGTRHPFDAVLTMSILSIMSGFNGYREIATFMDANKPCFEEMFNLKHGVPKHVSLRTFFMNLNFDALNSAFFQWANEYVPIKEGEWLAIDGKCIGSTVTDPHDSKQNFVSLVSMFLQKTGTVVKAARYQSKKTGEIGVVQQLIEQLHVKGIVITLDAMHCQKKR